MFEFDPGPVAPIGGDGEIAEFMSDATEAHITGLDYIESAIARAQQRTTTKRDRLDFRVGDLTCPTLPPRSFDMILSLDTIYFSQHYARTLESWKDLTTSDGQMVIFYSHGANPENPKETFRRKTLPPDCTPLAGALRECHVEFRTWDFTSQDLQLAERKLKCLEELEADFRAEGNEFLYENRLGETRGVLDAIANHMHARYLCLVQVQ